MLEKLRFQQLVEEHVTIKRLTTSMPGYRFVLAMVLALYVGFSRLHHLRFLEREPMLTGILEVLRLPPQMHLLAVSGVAASGVARQLLEVRAAHAAASVGGGPRAIEGGHAGYRHDSAHAVRQPDGRRARATTRRTEGRRATSRS